MKRYLVDIYLDDIKIHKIYVLAETKAQAEEVVKTLLKAKAREEVIQ